MPPVAVGEPSNGCRSEPLRRECTHGAGDPSRRDLARAVGRRRQRALDTFGRERPQKSVRTVGSGLTGLDDLAQYGVGIEPGQEAPSAPTEVVATG
jgi:hypothetical protein